MRPRGRSAQDVGGDLRRRPPRRRHQRGGGQLAHPGQLAARQSVRARLHARGRLGGRELAVEARRRARARRWPAAPCARACPRREHGRHLLERAGGEHLVDARVDAPPAAPRDRRRAARRRGGVGSVLPAATAGRASAAWSGRPAACTASRARSTRRGLRTSRRAQVAGSSAAQLCYDSVRVARPARLERFSRASGSGAGAKREVAERGAQVESRAALDDDRGGPPRATRR